ncbi:TY3B-TY3B protein [Emericellopsis cladophorae]|uniref:TY3B-TY3B protein n=1 Tax=Emericellopsis cladophorae TaxID=2686198 RepID=A0A9Q0BGP1_9HYPO|nr:TY3B-TY3B protein [Emericellopsis cladophorae]KAI6783920.1 TY3B-TY3B protein [Emericellopsis cladophorae]
MEYATEPTPFTAPLFVVWRVVDGKRKGRVVVDLRALNKVVVPDNYPLPRQDEVIRSLRGATYITAINVSSFFFQFAVRRGHRHRFTVTSHRGLERFIVAPMGFRNSPAPKKNTSDTSKSSSAYSND